MKNFQGKSILLGIGIGIILTSLISMIYVSGAKTEISNADIIQRAKALGMVDGSDLMVSTTAAPANPSPSPANGGKSNSPAASPTAAPQEVKLTVNEGDTSEKIAGKLVDLGLISDSNSFVNEIDNLGLSARIEVGEYTIKKGSDLKSIIKTVTNQ